MSIIERTKKYIVIPGFVQSKNDCDEHYISSDRLMSLYGVSRDECYVMTMLCDDNRILYPKKAHVSFKRVKGFGSKIQWRLFNINLKE